MTDKAISNAQTGRGAISSANTTGTTSNTPDKQAELIEKCRLTEEEIHKVIDHWNPLPSRLDGLAPEELKFKLFRAVADKAVGEAIPIISANLLQRFRNAIKQARADKAVDLTEEELEVYSAIEKQAISKVSPIISAEVYKRGFEDGKRSCN